MKKSIALLALIINIAFGYSQNTLVFYNLNCDENPHEVLNSDTLYVGDTLFSGKTFHRTKNGVQHEILNYKNGLKNGEYVHYNCDGTIGITGEYLNGEKTGLWVFRNYTGDTILKLDFNTDSTLIFYEHHQQDGAIDSRGYFTNIKEIKVEETHESIDTALVLDKTKDRRAVLYRVTGTKEGEWEYFYGNGTIETKGIYKHGKKNGIREEYRFGKENGGGLAAKGEFIDDKKNGEWSFYKKGRLFAKGKYVNDKLKDYYKTRK